jgi:hypothetical protein
MSFSIPFAAEGTRCHNLYSVIPACWGAQQKISMAPHKRLHFFTCNPLTVPHRRDDRPSRHRMIARRFLPDFRLAFSASA